MTVTEGKNKVLDIFPERGIVVDKSLTVLNDQWKKLPSFVVDYLISEMVDPADPTDGISKIIELLDKHVINADQKDWIKSVIREHGSYTLLGRLKLRYDEKIDQYWCDVECLGNQHVRIDPFLVAEYGENLLTTGAWGVFEISYDDSFVLRNKLFPFLVTSFKPIQIVGIDIDTWISRRNKFSQNEWLDLMITSIGFDPTCLSEEEKWLYMVRLVPFIEENVNLIELGGCMTGKTFTAQSLSSYGFVISGSQTTVASLFYDKLRRQLGLVGGRDVVIFDEFAATGVANKWSSGQSSLVDLMKDYMNSGRFGRGSFECASGCSFMFLGNIDCNIEKREVSSRYRSLFSPLPQIINRDRAFLDRLHGFLPGWKISTIKESSMAKTPAFMADYLSEIMHRMRNRSYYHVIQQNVDFGKMGQRDQRSLVRIGSGLLKLVFPHRSIDTIKPNELKTVLDIAVDLRGRVVDQLAIISPGEFKGVKLSYKIKENNSDTNK